MRSNLPSAQADAWLRSAVAVLVAGTGLAADLVVTELHYHPQSGNPAEEFLELHNASANPVGLAGWQLSRGVAFTFPALSLPAGGFLVVAADTNVFRAAHPGFSGALVGNWTGALSDRGETLELMSPAGVSVERISYATQGDWGERGYAASHLGFRGLEWLSGHDGRNRSLERINPFANGSLGQNWRSSQVAGGTPGVTNSVHASVQAPFLTEVEHLPAVPRSTNSVTLRARISGGPPGNRTVTAFHRLDGATNFSATPLLDDGLHGDGLAGDALFGALLAPQTNGTVVEYYVQVTGPDNLARTWPAPLADGGGQVVNALYQVDDSADGTLPRFRVVFTERDRQTLAAIEAQLWHSTSDAQINASLVASEHGVAEVRHNVGFRIRGSTSRDVNPPSRRIALPDDRTWHDQRVLVLNGVNPHTQVAGSGLAQLAGLPAGRSRLAELRENGQARAGVGSPVAGLYAQNESLNGDYADQAFPGDGNGNLYGTQGFGSLFYLGEDAAPYADPLFYTKETNAELNDWKDLIRLTRVLNQPSSPEYAADVAAVADTEEWVRYLAVNTLLANWESTLSNPRVTVTSTNTVVVTGDYFLYRGVQDPRFRLVPYDLDSCLGAEGDFTVGQGLYSFLGVPALKQLFQEPTIGSRYQAELRRLADSVFSPAQVDPLFDRILGAEVPAALLVKLKDFNRLRRDFVLSNLPAQTRVQSSFPLVGGYPTTTGATAALAGVASGADVVSVRIAGTLANWDATQGKWTATVPLLPGLNRLVIESVNAAGEVVQRQPYDLWREATERVVTGPLAADTTWRAEDGPFRINQQFVVPAGVTLTITAGTSVQFAPGAGLLVQGRLLAEGTADRRVQFLLHPRLSGRWSGLGFDGATNESRVLRADLRNTLRSPVQTTNSTLRLEHMEWPGHQANVLIAFNSSLTVRECVFPTMLFDEAVQGNGMPANGHVLFEGNTFGSTIGYADIVDFYGGQRPGPIPVFLDNVFLGGSDDGLDLDGTDAHIEGNVFQRFHKNHSDTSESSAIATGRGSKGETTRLTVVRNIFVDNDHDLTLKDYATAVVRQNTFVGSRLGSLAFSEPLRPGGAPPISMRARDCIWWNTPTVFFGLDQSLFTNAWFDVRVDNSVFSEPGPWFGTNNLAADPLFVNPTNDFRLRAGSVARARALAGQDLGAHVPAGAVIVGAPTQPTAARDLTFSVAGAGLTHYRFALDDADWGETLPLDQTITLSGLTTGHHRLKVIGMNSGNLWQPEPGTVAEWDVVADFASVRINELLADNSGAVPVGTQSPDLVELHNPGNLPFNLGGASATDNPDRPRKFVFPAGTVLPPGGHLTLYADSATQPPGIHLDFALDRDGEQFLLFAADGTPLDRVDFGPQLPGKSIGRDTQGDWTLTEPTFGTANRPTLLGDARRIRLNEWLANTFPGANDWVELFNPEPLPVLLDGLSLTDALAGSLRRAPVFPLTFIAARGFLALDASGTANRAGRLDLSLAADFGVLAVTDRNGTVLDSVLTTAQALGQTEGRRPDGFGPVGPLPGPSFEATNGVEPHPPITLKVSRDATGTAVIAEVSGTLAGRTYLLEYSPFVTLGWKQFDTLLVTGATGRFAPINVEEGARFFRVTVTE